MLRPVASGQQNSWPPYEAAGVGVNELPARTVNRSREAHDGHRTQYRNRQVIRESAIMIQTRFGSEVTVLGGDFNKGTVEVKRVSDGEVMKTYVYELKADGGAGEIVRAILAANQTQQPDQLTA